MRNIIFALLIIGVNFSLAKAQVRITEVVINPPCSGDSCEYVEIKNLSSTAQDISSWYISDDETGNSQWIGTFPSGTVLAPGDLAIVTKKIPDFISQYGSPSCTIVEIFDINTRQSRGLSNNGDFVGLYNNTNNLVHSYTWGNNVERAEFNGSSWTQTSANLADPCVSGALPISLVNFSASKTQHNVDLDWSTASEENAAYFLLERSTNGVHFTELATIPAAGNSTAQQEYHYTDRAPQKGNNYYRLRMVDLDGSYAFSPVRRVAFGQANGISVYPMPTSGPLRISFDDQPSEPISWNLFDQSGRLVLEDHSDAETDVLDIDVSGLPAGIYALRITSGQNNWMQRVVKN